ncbi:hypothetical protein CONPUDRAFT_84043, partial [Coniophora puteana RWD-64-598 SS2]
MAHIALAPIGRAEPYLHMLKPMLVPSPLMNSIAPSLSRQLSSTQHPKFAIV